MYTIRSFSIDGFWHRHEVRANFNDEVNVIIGRNGTGKTTFMNILHGVLAVDLDVLQQNHFDSATIILSGEGGQKKTVKLTKFDGQDGPFSYVEYRISNKKYKLVLIPNDDRLRPAYARRRANEEAEAVRNQLREYVSLASLSVYRMRVDPDFDGRERSVARRYVSPVDFRLNELLQQLTHYQLELSQQAQVISIDLQKQVLTSLLYEKEKDPSRISLNFVAPEERQKLQQAYMQLGVTGPSIVKRINEHVASIEASVKALQDRDTSSVEFATFEAKRRTDKVVRLSLAAREKTKDIYKQINLFLELMKDFIGDKQFRLSGGDLRVDSNGEMLPLDKLSSGEKQLLILLIEALLQRQEAFVFLADEPELSLHIAWQQKIVPAVVRMNPNAQIIVATHSPEIAGRYSDATIDMEDMIHAKS